MKKLWTLLFPILALTLAACAAPTGASSAKTDAVREYQTVSLPGGSVAIGQARAYRDGDGLVVSGQVERRHKLPFPGHIDLTVRAADGTLLAQETIHVSGLSSKRKGVVELPFRKRLATAPPEGATLRLRYHAPASAHEDSACANS